jgi:hypothetical protein
MRRVVIAGFLVALAVSGCASMKRTSPSEGSHVAQAPVPPPSEPQSPPPPASVPSGKSEPSTDNGADQGSTPAKPPDAAAPVPPSAGPPAHASPAKAKSSTNAHPAKKADRAAARTGRAVAPATSGAQEANPPAQGGNPSAQGANPASSTPPAQAAAAAPGASPTLNLADLEQRLRDTRAIGVFSKLSLKNQVDDLLNAFRALYRGPNKHPTAELRQRYDQLLLKVLTLLQDGDPPLAAAISSSREAIWSVLADPDKFAKI